MALYARTLLTRDTLRAFSFISLFTLSLLLPYVAIPHSLLHLAFIDASFPPRCIHYARTSRHFPISLAGATRPLCFFLDTVKRLNATTSPLRFLPHFLSLLRGLIYRNDMICYRDATEEKRNRFSAFASLLSNRWLCANHMRMTMLEVNEMSTAN